MERGDRMLPRSAPERTAKIRDEVRLRFVGRRGAKPKCGCSEWGSQLVGNGFEAWDEVIAHDYEGHVAKDEASLYESGPTRRWLKVKQRGWTVEEDRWQRRISAGA